MSRTESKRRPPSEQQLLSRIRAAKVVYRVSLVMILVIAAVVLFQETVIVAGDMSLAEAYTVRSGPLTRLMAVGAFLAAVITGVATFVVRRALKDLAYWYRTIIDPVVIDKQRRGTPGKPQYHVEIVGKNRVKQVCRQSIRLDNEQEFNLVEVDNPY